MLAAVGIQRFKRQLARATVWSHAVHSGLRGASDVRCWRRPLRAHYGRRQTPMTATTDANAPHKNAGNTRIRGRPFSAGNPGRPRGSRNRLKLLQGLLADGDLEAIVHAVIAKAKKGDLAAAKLVLDRVMPAPRTRPVEIDLPAIGWYDAAEALLASYGAVTKGIAAGQITPSEAGEIIAALDAHVLISPAASNLFRAARLTLRLTP
jgi:hypothetical protein